MRFGATGLTWKLYWVGLAQLVVVLAAAVVASMLAAHHWSRWDLPAVLDRVEPLLAHPAALEQRLLEMRRAGGPELSVYGRGGLLLASNVHPPLRARERGRHQTPFAPPRHAPPGPLDGLLPPLLGVPPPPLQERDAMVQIAVPGGEGTLVMKRRDPGMGPWPLALTLLCGALAVGVGAFLTARFIVRPLLGVEKELMANVAHELRTPMARIRVALEIASEGDAAIARASLEEIAVDLGELEALIDDVLTTTRLELSGETRRGLLMHAESVAAAEIVERAAARFRIRHPARTLNTELEPALPEVRADAALLRRALDNLLENAEKYSPDATLPIELSVSRRARRICFEVRDHGIGIEAKDLAHVFAPFFRGERSRTRSTGGVGLGLTLVKQIVEAHGGTVQLTSEKGSGTTASVALPANE